MKKLPQPIPYQGSKRSIVPRILQYFPVGIERLIEPFAGSAAFSVAVAYRSLAEQFWLNDLNEPLAALIALMIEHPQQLADRYERLWQEQLGQEREFYDEVRDEFNRTHCPYLLLYLLARCVKASVRYNANGEFNQSPDNRRKGRQPASMRQEILAFSALLQNKTIVTSFDFREIVADIDPLTDFVYLDPPYQGTSGTRDARYCSGVELSALTEFLGELNERDALFALSYDGIKGDKTYGEELPPELNLHQILIDAGRSSQSTLLGQQDITYESLYLSTALVDKLGLCSNHKTINKNIPILHRPEAAQMQLELSLR